MIRGLVIGKFLPLHKGHIALIRFAASRCDELIVSMSFTSADAIDPDLRFSWLSGEFGDDPSIRLEMTPDDFDDESLPLLHRTKLWAAFIRKRFPPIHVVFSSEEYGDYFAGHLGIPHEEFDRQRIRFPISATMIRNDPFGSWDFIPERVRPYFVKKVCFYGPESTGKTFMAEKLARELKTEWVPEVAREIISSNSFTAGDIVRIGYAQLERIQLKLKTANKILICDTDAITTQIYSYRYLGTVPEILFELERQVRYDQYFLFNNDTPWIADGMRDLGDERERMFAVFRNELEKRAIPYVLVQGGWSERAQIVKENILRWIEK